MKEKAKSRQAVKNSPKLRGFRRRVQLCFTEWETLCFMSASSAENSNQLATFTMAKRITLSPSLKPAWNTSATMFSPKLSSSTCITAL